MAKKKYVHIGPQFPPLGGVSVHIYRHSKLLAKKGWDVDVVDYSKLSLFNKLWKIVGLIFKKNIDVIHLHGTDIKSMIAVLMRPYTTNLKYTDHSGRWVSDLSGFKKYIFILVLKKINQLILVGRHLENHYDSVGIEIPIKKKVIENAFIAPPEEDEAEIWQTYTRETKDFIGSHSPLIVANAFQLVFYRGVDLYGLDMCVELTVNLKKKFPDVGFLFALANDNEETKYLNQNKQLISNLGLQRNFHIMTGQKQLWPILRKANLMVRPTNTDGDALSIREAIHFGCHTIASDVCVRPRDTTVFKSRSMGDLLEKTELIFR